ncbi:MAG TPA: endonuclease domain-containing protein, partial [Pseudorhodoplanes sp.]|nr:endonuclease domain-containing protein [Pseudorhodoplanes sp.]
APGSRCAPISVKANHPQNQADPPSQPPCVAISESQMLNYATIPFRGGCRRRRRVGCRGNEKARHLRKTMTPQEVKLWARLRRLRELGHHFRRQSPIGAFIEVDGGQHNEDRNRERDMLRDAALAKADKVLRFWNHEIGEEIDAVMEAIHRHLTSGPTRPLRGHPPLKGREGTRID